MTNGPRMGLHVHSRAADGKLAVYIRSVRPSMVKWLGGAADPALVALANDVGAITVCRVYQQEQDRRDFDRYLENVGRAMRGGPPFAAFEVSFNEAHQVGDDLAWKAQADIRGMQLAEQHGKKAIIGSFSVGMPDLASWPAYRPALEYAARNGHYLGLHEYGGGRLGMDALVTGQGREARGWLCLRYRKALDWAAAAGCPMPRILITESGIDDVTPNVADKTRGYRTATGMHPPSVGDYATQLARYARRLSEDAEVVGWCDFGFASEDDQWAAFDLARDDAMLQRVMETQAALPDRAPAKSEGGSVDLKDMLAAEFGESFADLRRSLPANPNGPNGAFARRALGNIDMLAVHHTAGPKGQTWQDIASFHVDKRQWAGIGYHIGIRGGRVAYLGDVSEARACCVDQNHRVLCVVLTGNYEAEAVDAADRAALARVVAVCQRWSVATINRQLKVLGHKDVPGQQTACPGRNLSAILGNLSAVPAAPPSGLPTYGDGIRRAVDKAHREHGITLNPTAALQAAIRRDGLVPTTREITVDDGGTWVCQRAERLTGGDAAIYYVARGDWTNVRKMPAP